MAAQARAVLVKEARSVVAQLAECPERHVVGASRMPLGQHESIGRVEDPWYRDQQQVEAGEVAPDVPHAALEVHAEKPEKSTALQLLPRAGGMARESVALRRFPEVRPFAQR